MKYKTLISYVFVVFLASVFAAGFIGLPENNDQYPLRYVSFQSGTPAIYRVLIPIIARAIMLFGVSADWSIAIIIFISGVGSFWALRRLYDLYGIGDLYTLISFTIIYLFTLNFRTPIEFTTVLIFCLSYYALQRRQYGSFFTIFFIACLHRETAILLIVLYVLDANARSRIFPRPNRTIIIELAYLFMTYGSIRLVTVEIFRNATGSGFAIWDYDVMGVYLRDPIMIIPAVLFIALFVFLYKNWGNIKYPFLKRAFVLFPIQILLHLIAGNPYEIRVMVESLPVLLAIIHPSVYTFSLPRIMVRKERKISGSNKTPSP